MQYRILVSFSRTMNEVKEQKSKSKEARLIKARVLGLTYATFTSSTWRNTKQLQVFSYFTIIPGNTQHRDAMTSR